MNLILILIAKCYLVDLGESPQGEITNSWHLLRASLAGVLQSTELELPLLGSGRTEEGRMEALDCSVSLAPREHILS